MTTTVRAATHEFMRRCGMTTVFGNPGSTELKFFRDWPPDFRYVLWYTAIQKPCGPVFVSIPEDDGDALCEPVPERQVSAGIAPHPLALRALAEALSTARSPVLVMGAAVDQDDAWDAAIGLADAPRSAGVVEPDVRTGKFPRDAPVVRRVPAAGACAGREEAGGTRRDRGARRTRVHVSHLHPRRLPAAVGFAVVADR